MSLIKKDKYLQNIPQLDKEIKLYIIMERPNQSDYSLGTFSLENHHILKSLIQDLNYTEDEVRIGLVVPYALENEKDNLETSDYVEYFKFLENDIKKHNPKVIIGLGQTVAGLFNVRGTLSEIRSISTFYENIEVFFTYTERYLNYVGATKGSPAYLSVLNDFKLAVGQNKEQEITDFEVVDWNNPERLWELLKDDKEIVFDYEASSLDVRTPEFYVCSIGFYGRQSQRKVYMYLYSLEHLHTEINAREQDKRVYDVLNKLFSDESKTFIVFNCTYEFKVTYHMYDVKIKNLIDVLQYARVLAYRGSLKEQASIKLGITKWNDTTSDWVGHTTAILSRLKPSYRSKTPKPNAYYSVLVENPDWTLNEYLAYLQECEREVLIEPVKELMKIIKSIAESHDEEIQMHKDTIRMIKYCIEKEQFEGDYTLVPHKIMSKYCMLDVVNTNALYDIYVKEIEDSGANPIVKEVYNQQGLLACELECNSISWNEKLAVDLEQQYIDIVVSNMKKFITADLVKPNILNMWFKNELKSRLKSYKGDLTNYNISKELEDLPADFEVPELMTDYTESQKKTLIYSKNIDELKEFYNPNSNTAESRAVFSDSVMTDRVKIASMLYYLYNSKGSDKTLNERFPYFMEVTDYITSLNNNYLAEFFSKNHKIWTDKLLELTNRDFVNKGMLESILSDTNNFLAVKNSMDPVDKNIYYIELQKVCFDYLEKFNSEIARRLKYRKIKKFISRLKLTDENTELVKLVDGLVSESIMNLIKSEPELNLKELNSYPELTQDELALFQEYLFKSLEGTSSEVLVNLYKVFLTILKVQSEEEVFTSSQDANNIEEVSEIMDATSGDFGEFDEDASDELVDANLAKLELADNNIERDIDLKKTWIDEFKLVVYFRMIKKVYKSYTAFLLGRTGRSRVTIVKRSEVEKPIWKPLAGYYDRELRDGETYMKMTSFSPNSAKTKRFQCLRGNTSIRMYDGRQLFIRDMEKEVGNYVLSYDIETKGFVSGRIVNWAKTGIDKELMRITFDEGLEVDCTPNHKFLLSDGVTYVEAQNLSENDIIKGLRNRRIVNIQHLQERDDVYDICVEKYNNFVIGRGNPVLDIVECIGIVVHNSPEHILPWRCLSSDTKIQIGNENLSVMDLYVRYKDSVFELENYQSQGKSKHKAIVKMSGVLEDLYELEFDNGAKVKCTPTHRFLTKDGRWVQAKDITENDELVDWKNDICRCPICGGCYNAITRDHIRNKHGLEWEEFIKLYPNCKLKCDKSRIIRAWGISKGLRGKSRNLSEERKDKLRKQFRKDVINSGAISESNKRRSKKWIETIRDFDGSELEVEMNTFGRYVLSKEYGKIHIAEYAWIKILEKWKIKYELKKIIHINNSTGNYTFDIYLPEYNVDLEIDGSSHYIEGRDEWYNSRDNYIKSLGYIVIRLNQPDIKDELKESDFKDNLSRLLTELDEIKDF